MLALTDLWNDAFLNSQGRIISPFLRAFGSYPGFVAALEDKLTNGGGKGGGLPHTFRSAFSRSKGSMIGYGVRSIRGQYSRLPSPVIDGGSHLIYNYSLNQSANALSSELIAALDTPFLSWPRVEERGVSGVLKKLSLTNHDRRICSMFSYADTLAFGFGGKANNGRAGVASSCNIISSNGISSPSSPPLIQGADSALSFGSVFGIGGCGNGRIGSAETATVQGNRPSTLLICGTCDAFACGQMIALAEHRALVKAWLWDVDPFEATNTRSIQKERTEYFRQRLSEIYQLLSSGEDIEDVEESLSCKEQTNGTFVEGMNMASKTILKHFAIRNQKHHHQATKTP